MNLPWSSKGSLYAIIYWHHTVRIARVFAEKQVPGIFTDAYERTQSHTLFYVGTLEAEIMREWAEPAAHTVVASEVDPVPQYPAHQGPKEFHDIGMQTQGITSSGTMFRDDFPQNDGTTHNKIVSTSIPGTC